MSTPRPEKGPRSPVSRRGIGAWPGVVVLVLVLLALAAAVNGTFTVKRVEVVGANLPSTAIVQTADVTGKNIFRLRSDAVVARLAQIPSIEVSRVDASFPDTVKIYARLREPYVAWRSGTAIYLVDRNGKVIGRTGPTALPVIAGGAAPPDWATLQAAHYAAESLRVVPDGAVLESQLDPRTGMLLVGKSGWQALIGKGDPQTMVRRVATLAALLVKVQKLRQLIKFADLRYPEPYYRLR